MAPVRPPVRWLVVAVAAGLVLVLGGAPPGATAAAGRLAPVFMNIVAHQDDDLLFQTPDLYESIRAGDPSVTVYTTAGEASHPDTLTPEQYAALRAAGERRAYAAMAGVPDDWTDTRLVTDVGTSAELDTLRGRPQVRLVFLRLHDYWDLRSLWYGWVGRIATVAPTGSPAVAPDSYTRTSLIRTLAWLMRRYRPSVIRTQNPEPVTGFDSIEDPGVPYDPDNIDHTATARFADEAVKDYQRAGDGRAVMRYYRGYDAGQLPVNLSPAQRLTVRDRYFLAYTDVDWHVRGELDAYQPLRRSEINRWPAGTTWTGRDADGGLYAFAVLSGRLYRWRQSPDGSWGPPVGSDGPPLAPYVTAGRGADGRLRVFALDRDSFDVVTAVQTAPGGGFSAWTSLGDPNGPGGTQTGVPAVAADATGRLQFFVRNAGGGISAKRQNADGTFGDWLDLHGTGVQDGLSAVTDGQGRIHVFATRCDAVGDAPDCSIGELAQNAPGGGYAWTAVPGTRPCSAPTAVLDPAGRLRVFYRDAQTARVHATVRQADGAWPATDTDLGAPGGTGGIAAATVGGRLILATRADGGRGAVLGDDGGRWTTVPVQTETPPAVAVDRTGRVVVLTVTYAATLSSDVVADHPMH